VRPSLWIHVTVKAIACNAQKDVLAPYKGNHPGEVSYRRAALIPHLEEEIGSQDMNLKEIEEEGLKHGSCIFEITNTITTFQKRKNTIHLHPGAKTPQYSDRSSTISFDARASGHCRCEGREFCSCTTFEKKSGSICTKYFFYRAGE
jgi:hypothetical protein